MVITYTNEHGTIRMNGTGSDNAWCIYEITGIGFPKKNYTYNTYAGIIGHEKNTETIPSRVMTISGDISEKAQKSLSMSRAMRILNTDGELTIQTGNKVRRARVRTLDFTPAERKSVFKSFVLQIEADIPYFFGMDTLKYNIFSREGLLSSPFVLPCAFGRRNTYADIFNSGDVECEPVLEIYKPLTEDTAEYAGPLVLLNETTGAKITLNHIMTTRETVVIDIPNRKITSDVYGNLLNNISLDTILRDFILKTGKNRVSFESDDKTLVVSCSFEEMYLEASHDE